MTESRTRKSLDDLPVAGEDSGRGDGDDASMTARTRGSEEKHELERGISGLGFVNEVGVTLIHLQGRSMIDTRQSRRGRRVRASIVPWRLCLGLPPVREAGEAKGGLRSVTVALWSILHSGPFAFFS